jgi:hypothetical protein
MGTMSALASNLGVLIKVGSCTFETRLKAPGSGAYTSLLFGVSSF